MLVPLLQVKGRRHGAIPLRVFILLLWYFLGAAKPRALFLCSVVSWPGDSREPMTASAVLRAARAAHVRIRRYFFTMPSANTTGDAATPPAYLSAPPYSSARACPGAQERTVPARPSFARLPRARALTRAS